MHEFFRPFIVNAYHSPGILDLRFGIFLPPVYQYGRPKLLNFATMGTTLGHELGHEIEAFMEEVENYDNDTCRIYKEKKKCLVEQYSEFQIKKIGKKIITRFLLRGNFSLPALNFTTEQLLYISLAQMWCSVSSWEKEQLHYELDIHAPSDIRIIGMLRNLREFSNAFNCPRGSRMNPAERCAFRLRS
ncbi:endothelin-converting enzyme 1 [Caerostris darwini]|uniref:Endothelin-converting enzyme 1 n=1 Tax=Caerostris darwini TaxID=1538125 RepID=A0AAV4TQF9_9ARAC|nr:endothelin-converting enzyme 1 [Caerostris darwini]